MSWPEEHTFKYRMCLFTSIVHGSSQLSTAFPSPAPQTPLSIKRTLYGSSQTRGVLFVSLSNNDHAPMTVGYLETLPALVTLWMHTMKVDVGGIARGTFLSYCPEFFLHSVCHTDDLVSDIIYQPPLLLANGHHGPSTLQTTLTIPANSILRLSIGLSKTFLKYTEHPPDAMRGWDLPPAILFPIPIRDVVVQMNGSLGGRQRESIPKRMYTPTLLVDLPTPDFSMPYNVIILSCTLITLVFGSMFNLLTRKWIIVKIQE